jgi:isoamylase
MALGVPMILMGDEVRRTQRGNNNAYCHDDEMTWFDWSLLDRRAEVHRFVQLLLARRSLRSAEHEDRRLSLNQLLREARNSWHGVKLDRPDWRDCSYTVVLSTEVQGEQMLLHLILNAYWEPLEFDLPAVDSEHGGTWHRWIDTGLDSPQDIVEWRSSPAVAGQKYRVEGRSVVVLFADPKNPNQVLTS